MILVHPPVAKPCEPPAGIARLCGALKRHGVRNRVIDANLEGLLFLLKGPPASSDPWTARAFRNLSGNLASLRSWSVYHNLDRYKRAVIDLNRLLKMSAAADIVRLDLANYGHQALSPVRSDDLIRAAEMPESNPFYPYFKRRFLALLEDESPSVIGFSLNYLSQALCTFAMIGFLKRECPGLVLVLGGGLVTSWVRRPNWRDPFRGLVDELVAGPGEDPLLSIVGITPSKGEHSTPDYSALPLNDYLAAGPVLPYSASNGCYWNRCSFCPEKAEGNPYVPIPSERVLRDIRLLVERKKPVLVHLLDSSVSPALMKTLTENPPGVPWYGFARVTRHLTDPDFCTALRRSGCVMLKLGLESGDQGVLDAMQKGVDLEMASLTLKTLRKVGIATYVYLLFGTPAEGWDEARRTLQFTVKHSDRIDFLNLAIFNLPAHGAQSQRFETKPFCEGDLSLYVNFSHPKGWNRGVVRQYLDKEFKRHPAVAAIVRRDPPVFTSNHAPFLVMERDEGRKKFPKMKTLFPG